MPTKTPQSRRLNGSSTRGRSCGGSAPRGNLVGLAPLLLAGTFAGQGLLGAPFVAGLQIKGVFLDVLDDVFLLDLSLETAERAFDGLAFLDADFCHGSNTPFPREFVRQ